MTATDYEREQPGDLEQVCWEELWELAEATAEKVEGSDDESVDVLINGAQCVIAFNVWEPDGDWQGPETGYVDRGAYVEQRYQVVMRGGVLVAEEVGA